jgi:glycosyltransferase involved in cell wall biosynthesis
MKNLRSEKEIMKNWGRKKKPLVSISCITYNHEKYIEDAIEGFLIQETNFPFEVLIHDDASTDNTANIIKRYKKKYPNLIKPIYQKENQYSKRNPIYISVGLYNISKGKYIALCEGDDYWTHPKKLHIQADFMEKNEDYSLCFHAAKFISNKKEKNCFLSNKNFIINKGDFYSHKGFYNHPPTASFFLRKKYIINLPKWFYDSPVGDIPLKLILSEKGNLYYINKIMSIRRVNVNGSWNNRIISNYNMKIKHYNEMIKMLIEFNKWSNFKHNTEITNRIFIFNCFLKIYNEKFKQRIIFIKKNKVLFNKLPLLKKIAFYVGFIFPFLFKFIVINFKKIKMKLI